MDSVKLGRNGQIAIPRAAVLASLAAVDAVVVFAEDTPINLIEALRPDLLVKGADYAKAQVVGADRVESWGGKVLPVMAPLVPYGWFVGFLVAGLAYMVGCRMVPVAKPLEAPRPVSVP